MLELLSPAGSMESVEAAVQNGADAVYFGYGAFNARRNAKNFTPEQAAQAVSYCHLRGVKVHLTLNTLLTDRELPLAAQLAAQASDMGVDALIVQDLGVVRMLKQAAPDLPLHASTQMSVHSLDGVKRCADLGFQRVVLSRELSRDQIEYICARSPVEIETFAHGALCMCYSGQCYFSAVIGERSGNRGLCAQPCRLKYGWGNKADGYPLSLKDASMVEHLRELKKMGVACLKLEGRMKRPEYVAVVTRIYANAIKENREPTRQELEELEQAFSRQGFTDGYYMDRKGPQMFGVREEMPEPKELFTRARATYENGENRKEPVQFFAKICAGQPAQAAVQDREGHLVTVEGPEPESAVNVPLTREKVAGQLSRTGGTPYACEKAVVRIDEGLSLPLSALNAMRRQALEELSRQRVALPERRTGPFRPGVRYESRRQPPVFTLSLRRAEQLSDQLLALSPALIYLPVEELSAHPELLERTRAAGVPVGAALPRICWDREWPQVKEALADLKKRGVDQALCPTWDGVERALQLGLRARGDFGLNTFNSQALKQLRQMGLESATLSFELKLAQIRDLSKAIDTEFIAYGRLPLMITENCIVYNHSGQHTCAGVNQLVDRKGERFPVVKAFGCRNEILNAKKIFLADKAADWQRLGLWAARLQFTTENAAECVQVLSRYLGQGRYQPNDYTRGLYYRGVE
ncbi:MAG: U32 family peptidase [Clostridiales bacterium]|nr:U32 family peptidase [Clostridiales bacterium]